MKPRVSAICGETDDGNVKNDRSGCFANVVKMAQVVLMGERPELNQTA